MRFRFGRVSKVKDEHNLEALLKQLEKASSNQAFLDRMVVK